MIDWLAIAVGLVGAFGALFALGMALGNLDE